MRGCPQENMKPDTPAVSSSKPVAMFITVFTRQTGKYGLSQFRILASVQGRTFSNCSKKDPRHSGTSGVITHCRNKPIWSQTLLCAVTCLREARFPQSTPEHTTTVTRFSPKMSFNFPFAWRQQGGLCLASPLSFIPQHARFQIPAEECFGVSVPLLCGSTPCGNEAQVLRNLPLLWLASYQWWRRVSPCFHFLPVSSARWLPLEHESTLSSSL